MFYKLSNTSSLKSIENEFKAQFRYPDLYEPKLIINGFEESNLPVIISQDARIIESAIWGILPQCYDDSWEAFQNVCNTLNTHVNDKHADAMIYPETLSKQRCLIIVNGLFTSVIRHGKLCTKYLHLKNHKPFCVAGIYNTTEDGFLTCSLLIKSSNRKYSEVSNFGNQEPLIFKKQDFNQWLNPTRRFEHLELLIRDHEVYDFESSEISINDVSEYSWYPSEFDTSSQTSNLKIS
ncbi:SOS response-associated peptidase family protein [uncultured Psychroserpens sp.]|uniref:SOS response-associated peptidase family protein n=1 Tax=uncultured Psychroserpens sp. TaxID=255436 RepID=UPI00262C59A4|nr:SOS response-associated peptidase family protein [uncultured Psychroserpens sp.]